MTEEQNRAEEQARSQLMGIVELMQRYHDSPTQEEREQAYDEIMEDPLSVEVRSGWSRPGEEMVPEEFRILLCTGGPAVQIRGELDEHRQPFSVSLEYQDWFEPWQPYCPHTEAEENSLLDYCSMFFFGE